MKMVPYQTKSHRFAFLGLILVLGLAIFPWLGPPVYFISLLFTVFLYVVLTSSWNLIGGYAGYLSFGHKIHGSAHPCHQVHPV